MMSRRSPVVDDTPANIQALAGTLKGKGYQVSVATNGKQTLDLLMIGQASTVRPFRLSARH
jgi:CheY-like chemotaxis protein